MKHTLLLFALLSLSGCASIDRAAGADPNDDVREEMQEQRYRDNRVREQDEQVKQLRELQRSRRRSSPR